MNGELLAFLTVVNMVKMKDGAEPNSGNLVPEEDVLDLACGVKSIPEEVTNARRSGQTVKLVREGANNTWYWKMPGGIKIPNKV